MQHKDKKGYSIEFLVGLFVVAGFAALLFTALKAANLGTFSMGTQTYVVSAEFENIGGLKPRAPVKSAGVVIGRVRDISFDGTTYQANVTMEIEQQYLFPTDTEAQILTSGLLGEQYIGFVPGAEEDNLADGSKILRTQSAMVLESMISKFMYSFVENKSKE